MRPNINFKAFFELIKANEEAPNFNLRTWENKCGTYGCLIGNYAIKHDIKNVFNLETRYKERVWDRAATFLGISLKEAHYLFYDFNPHRCTNHITMYYTTRGERRDTTNREAAINRVRKFVYYHLHKREMCLDDKGVTEKSRQVGDVNFAAKVKELCAV